MLIIYSVIVTGTEHLCHCKKTRSSRVRKDFSRGKDHYKRKRQTFVYNPEEEIWHEPYMHSLRREFSDVSLKCDSKIEVPWKEIALPNRGMKIRGEFVRASRSESVDAAKETIEGEVEEKESTGAMALPWKQLVAFSIVQPEITNKEMAQCDSSLEIPWDILALDEPIRIGPIPQEESCIPEDVEIPWNDILIPRNIIIQNNKKIVHPSNNYPPSKKFSSRTNASTTACRDFCLNPCARRKK